MLVDGKIGMRSYEILLLGTAGNPQHKHLAFGIGFKVMRHLCGHD